MQGIVLRIGAGLLSVMLLGGCTAQQLMETFIEFAVQKQEPETVSAAASLFYLKGDYENAAKLYLQAAEAGYAEAQYNIAMAYLEGQGVRKDKYEGYMWLYLAKEQGFRNAKRAWKEVEDELSDRDKRIILRRVETQKVK